MARTDRRWVNCPQGSNWGEFGPDDQLGRMNLITPERRRAALAEAREGLCFSLSLPLDYPGGSQLTHGLRQPPKLFAASMGEVAAYNIGMDFLPGCRDISCDDGVVIYSQYSTQWDSLAHWGQLFDADGDGVPEKVYYNGFRAGVEILGADDEGGPRANALGMEHLARSGVQGRGVMVDISRCGSAVGHGELMRCIEDQGAQVQPGDIFCLYTGMDVALLAMEKAPDPARLHGIPGLDGSDPALLAWIDSSGVAAICSDNLAVEHSDFDASRSADEVGHSMLPLHELCLFKLGIHLGELWRLSELKEWLAAHGRSSFLLTAPPWMLPGSVGSPVNPIATV